MNSKTKSGRAAARVAALTLAVFVIVSSARAAQPPAGGTQNSSPTTQNVNVVNAPVITGTVNANQSGAWNVGFVGTPTVNIGSMPAVSLSGTPTVNANVRDVDNGARHPFTIGCQVTTSTNFSAGCSMQAPAGKELVIETESFAAGADPSNTQLLTAVGVVSGGNPINAYGTIQDNGFLQSTQAFFEATSAFKLYADPNTGPA